MAMVVQNNIHAQIALGELNKNNDKLRKTLEKVSSGQKVVGAKDDSSAYSISEKMRVRIRALDQANQNVQNGNKLLTTAEAGIQQQIDMVRTIREKVINAANDTNTDEDRKIIQKEIDQLYKQIDQTAYETDYNSKKILLGDTYCKTISRWVKAQDVILAPNSSMDIIPDIYDTLDGIEGPFDVFKRFGTDPTTIEPLYGDTITDNFSGGTKGTPSEIQYNFSASYADANLPSDLNELGFSVTGVTEGGYQYTVNYVLTTDPSINYSGGHVKININGANTFSEIASRVASAIQSNQGSCFDVSTDSAGNINLKSVNDYTKQNENIKFAPSSAKATSVTTPHRQGADKTNIADIPKNLSGGKNDVYETKILTEDRYVFNPATDTRDFIKGETESLLVQSGAAATLSVNVSSASAGSGVVLSGYGTGYVKFVDGDTITQDSDGVWLVGKNANGSASSSIAGMTLSMSGGTMTLTATSRGEHGNRYSISADGFEEILPKTTYYTAVNPLKAEKDTDWSFTAGTDGATAYYDTKDLSDYDLTIADTDGETKLNEFINALKGKDIYAGGLYFSFIDTTVPYSMEAMSKTGYNIDLKELRTAVKENGANILDTFVDMMKEKCGSRVELRTETTGEQKLRIWASQPGQRGNLETISLSESHLAKYDVDFKDWFEKNADLLQPSVSDYLDGKAIRVYCATCKEQWYNIEFYKPDEVYNMPESTSPKDFHSILIDVSDVKDYKTLVEEIYKQGDPQFQLINHFTYLAANPDDGILTVFDNRAFDPLTEPLSLNYPYKQEMGAKIADGSMSDVVKVKKDLLERRLVIHDTDKASMNIRVHIPDMRLDSIFGIMPDYEKQSVKDYSLASKEDREALLGKPPRNPGILDVGLNYLLDAAVLVGAQNARLEYTQSNVTVQTENTTAAESTIRDADMAKEMAEYTKYNILTQSAQAMLAQANQNGSAVLSLLQ